MTQASFQCLNYLKEISENENMPYLKINRCVSLNQTNDCSSVNTSFCQQNSNNCFSLLSFQEIQSIEFQNNSRKQLINTQKQLDYHKIQNYQLIEIVGQGEFGKVYRGIFLPLCKEVAVKIINFNNYEQQTREVLQQYYQKQIQLLKMLQQKSSFRFTCEFFGSFVHQGSGYIIMQFLEGFSLQELVQSQIELTAQQEKFYLASLLLALQQLHQNVGCIHRDIKPENLIVSTKGELFLIDFGCAKRLNKGQRTSSIIGTCQYFSPSRFRCNYSNQADIWSFGVTAYQLVTKSLPFRFTGIQDCQQQQKFYKLSSILKKKSNLKLSGLQDSYPHFQSLIQGLFNSLLQPNLKEQFNINSLKDSMYFNNFDWQQLRNNKIKPPKTYTMKEINQIKQTNSEQAFSEF